jgi:lipopolysaccharide transport system ATP-binding protein
MSDIVIGAENLGKKYIIGHQAENGRYVTLRDVVTQNVRGLWHKTKDLVHGKPIIQGDTLEEVWALKDVSFEIPRGDAVGIIGRNGAGKSTLLKILSRITEPSSGRATIKGRVASLLEVGTGFHPELTGRENIYLNGAILGMTRAEIKRKFDEIVAFAEVGKFLDTPVKRYSSGMYVRLAFAVAAHLEPEILIVDEVLAVGDGSFQKKCLGKMGDVASEGRTVLFVSHNMGAIKALCKRVILLTRGTLEFDGDMLKGISKYSFNSNNEQAEISWKADHAPSTQSARLVEVSVQNVGNPPSTDLVTELPIQIGIKFEVLQSAKIGVSVLLYNSEGMLLFASMSNHEPAWHMKMRPLGIYHSTCEIPANLLADGRYLIAIPLVEGFYESGIVEKDVIQFTAHEQGFVRGDLPYPQTGYLIQPLLKWKSIREG